MTSESNPVEVKRGRTAYAEGVRRPTSSIAGVAAPAFRSSRAYPWQHSGMVAVDVLLNWAFEAQRVASDATDGLHDIEASASGFTVYGHSPDGCYAIDKRHQIGAVIQASHVETLPDFHPAAEAVLAEVRKHRLGSMIEAQARLGTHPSGWAVPARWVVPQYWDVPEVDAQWVYAEGQGPKRNPHCPTMFAATPDSVAAARLRWLDWYDALVDLTFLLSTRNLGFVVVPPAFAREPWSVAVAADRPASAKAVGAGLLRVTDASHAKAVRGRLPLLLAFTAPWSAPCRELGQMLERVAGEASAYLRIGVADANDAPFTMMDLKLRAVPSLLLYRRGEVVDTLTGRPTLPALRGWIAKALDRRR